MIKPTHNVETGHVPVSNRWWPSMMRRAHGPSLLWLVLFALSAQAQDTLRHSLHDVTVTADRVPSASVAQAPTQVLQVERLEQQGIESLSEATRLLSGVTLKDYGGVGGMKTISARGLGSQFSMLALDGVPVSDCQNGQVDLGRYALGEADYIGFAQGQFSDFLQSARALAAGNVMNMESRRPDSTGGRLGLEGGSYGLLSPTLSFQHKVSPRWSYSLWGNYLQCEGDYPFTLYYTVSGRDSSSVERREHSAVRNATLEGNLFYRHGQHDWVTKVRHYQSEMQLPGPVVFYSQRGTEQTTACVSLLQSRYRLTFSDKLRLQVMGKYSNLFDTYSDTNLYTPTYNEYLQQEGYLSATLAYEPLDRLTFSLASDGALSSLRSNLPTHNEVHRRSSQSVLMASFRREWIDLSANALLTLVGEESNGGMEREYHRLSPYAGVNLRLWASEDKTQSLRMRYFFKENYRLPTFNEVYFYTTTRTNLRPERALQHNLGLTFVKGGRWKVEGGVDAYYNRVTDKIIAIPAQNLFLWSMMNLGKVEIWGMDVAAEAEYEQFRLRLNYSYQRAHDMTDPESKTYRQQIPYTPRHSGGATLTWESPWLTASYNAFFVGARYSSGQNTPNYHLRPYVDQGITLSRTFGHYTLRAQVLNLFNVQYEVVRSYPMMGRNYRIAAVYQF